MLIRTSDDDVFGFSRINRKWDWNVEMFGGDCFKEKNK